MSLISSVGDASRVGIATDQHYFSYLAFPSQCRRGTRRPQSGLRANHVLYSEPSQAVVEHSAKAIAIHPHAYHQEYNTINETPNTRRT